MLDGSLTRSSHLNSAGAFTWRGGPPLGFGLASAPYLAGGVRTWEVSIFTILPQGLKPLHFRLYAARLKSCPSHKAVFILKALASCDQFGSAPDARLMPRKKREASRGAPGYSFDTLRISAAGSYAC
jgi:hypothetical protein